MLVAALSLLLAATPGSFSLDDPSRPEALVDPPLLERRDPCEGREGWVGDGEDGRASPTCGGPDADADADPAGLEGQDGRWREEDLDPDDAEPG
jgi:hypothetical protein